jgi:electron transfer flavoprotein alpha/beta subunit
MAEEVLRYGLGRCADMAVLLTDKALGGADTVATANPLAFAIRKIVKEILNKDSDYYVVSGMQSVDGDTAQVPPQIAEELGLPCIAYVTKAEYKNNRFEFTRIISGGSQVAAPRQLPAVITVAKHEYPLFATFAASRRASRMEIIRWSSDDIKATHIGVKGSKTSVIRVFPPGKSTRKCEQVGDAKSLAKLLVDSLKSSDGNVGQAGDGQRSRYHLPNKRADKFEMKRANTSTKGPWGT